MIRRNIDRKILNTLSVALKMNLQVMVPYITTFNNLKFAWVASRHSQLNSETEGTSDWPHKIDFGPAIF